MKNLAPSYESLELGIGDSLLIKAVALAAARQAKAVKEDMKKRGDLGEVAEASRAKQQFLQRSSESGSSVGSNHATRPAHSSGGRDLGAA